MIRERYPNSNVYIVAITANAFPGMRGEKGREGERKRGGGEKGREGERERGGGGGEWESGRAVDTGTIPPIQTYTLWL